MRKAARLAFLLAAVCACGRRGKQIEAPPALPPVALTPTATPCPSSSAAAARLSPEQERSVLYDRLVSTARRYHVFSETAQKNLGFKWDTDVAALRDEFASAQTDDDMVVALTRFANSLHDVHCQFRPAKKGDRLALGFDVAIDWREGRPDFYVDKVNDTALAKDVLVGDRVVSVNGVPAAKLLRTHMHDSNMNAPFTLGEDVAEFLTRRRTTRTRDKEGDASTWVLRAAGAKDAKDDRTVRVHWGRRPPEEGSDFALDYTSKDCVNAVPRTYGSYATVGRGYRLCVLTSNAGKYRDYPIVRQVSMRYDELPHGAILDYELVKAKLATLAGAKGVILDMQDNPGGVNPNLFLDWWADKPYTDTFTRVLFDSAFSSKQALADYGLNMTDAAAKFYLDAFAKRGASDRFAPPRPFACKAAPRAGAQASGSPEAAATCDWDNRYAPSHRVTKLPVALVLGPGCGSSCDAFAWHFQHQKFGPIVGRPSMAGFTTHRSRFPVSLRDGAKPLGTVDFAASFDTATADSNDSIEARPIAIDVPVMRTFENREKFDQVVVDAAIGALEGWGKK
jgi:hypothetical protein